ncbi:MAG: hypothetical protein ACW99G_05040 [Candidatus Thorarchaeota archaeon]|jgi:hypothetical protein
MDMREHTKEWMKTQVSHFESRISVLAQKETNALRKVESYQHNADDYANKKNKLVERVADLNKLLTDWEL